MSPKTEEESQVLREKVGKVRRRLYISPGLVASLTHMFTVPKGLFDWRIVYNGTSSGLNAALWAPHFGLPTIRHTLRSLMAGYFQCDMDVGEMFLNFWLHTVLCPYAGVDVSHVRTTKGRCLSGKLTGIICGRDGVKISWE